MTDAATDAISTDAAAEASAPPAADRTMMQRDLASAALGMVVERDEPGLAVVSMLVRDDMTNGFRITHGGLVFTLADTAFAIACNEDDNVTVAAGAETGRSARRQQAVRIRWCMNGSLSVGGDPSGS